MGIDIQQPQSFDLVGDIIHIAGVAGGASEASYNYVITEGHDEVRGNFMAGDGTGGHGQFQATADVSGAASTHAVAYVDVFHTSARDGSPWIWWWCRWFSAPPLSPVTPPAWSMR